MDDFNTSSLQESKNEWSSRLINILTPFIIEGIKSMFNEAQKLCSTNGEDEKYLMTFQNFLTRTPKWNANIIEEERKRIVQKSNCEYLEDLITCVHIIQLKLLTAVRVGTKQKKINISIPKLDDFIHKIYINSCRKLYSNVYLFEIGTTPLQVQKHNRELELIIQDCILNTIRESIPVETILRAYLDETMEEHVEEEVIEKEVKQIPQKNMLKSRKRQKVHEPTIPEPDTDPVIKLSGIDDPVDNEIKMLNEIKPVERVGMRTGGSDVQDTLPFVPISLDTSSSPPNSSISFNGVDKIHDTQPIESIFNSSFEPKNEDSNRITIGDPVSLDPITINFDTLEPTSLSSSSKVTDNLLGDITIL